MRELTYYVACSVDGSIALADGSHDGFSQDGKYLADLFSSFPETVLSHLRDVLGIHAENKSFNTVLMGRKTYEIGLKDGVTSPYLHMKQYLFSRTMQDSLDERVQLVSENAVELVGTLKKQTGKDIWLCGGANLAAILFENSLVD